MTARKDVIVLGYAGGLETSVALAWLADEYQADVVALTLDLGQGIDLSDVRDQALAIGAVRAHVIDAREEFAQAALAPALALGCDEPRVAALARPIVGRHLARLASIEGTGTVAHGSHQPLLAPTSLDAAILETDGDLHVLAPCRDWDLTHDAIVEFAETRGIPVPPDHADLITVRNLWGRAMFGRILDNPLAEAPPGAFQLTRSVSEWPSVPATVVVEFVDGVPVSLNGVAMPLVELLGSLETIVGAHGIGRFDYPAVGTERVRTIEEAPAPAVLHQAIQALASTGGSGSGSAVSGTVTMVCAMGECRVEEARP